METLPKAVKYLRSWRRFQAHPGRSRMTNHLAGERGAAVLGWAACGHACVVLLCHLHFIFTFCWKADLAVPAAFDPHVWSLQKQNSERPRGDHCPQPTAQSESALCWKRKCAFWKSWRLHSLFSKHYISRQWVSRKLWEHLAWSGFVTFLSWGVGRLQWSVENRSLVTQKSFCCFRHWRESPGNIEYFSRGDFWAAFSLCKAVLWAWLRSTSCSPLVQTP